MQSLPPARVPDKPPRPIPPAAPSSPAPVIAPQKLGDGAARAALLGGGALQAASSAGAPAQVASLDRERQAGAQLEASLSVLEGCLETATATQGELGRNRETLVRASKNARQVAAEADEGREIAHRMQRRTGFTGFFVQMYEAVTGK